MIHRKLRDTVRSFVDESHLMRFVNLFKDNMWPGGQLKPLGTPRLVEEKARTRDEANRKLSALIPGKYKSIVWNIITNNGC